MSFQLRIDVAPISRVHRDPATGYLHVTASLSRTGIYEYLRADGTIHRELRLPDEVFAEDSVETFRSVVVTDGHPSEPVTAENARTHQRGFPAGAARRADGDVLEQDIVITDAELIAKAESGKNQVSPGYFAEVDMTPGVWKGERYDAVQRRIRANHIAIVHEARGGPSMKLHLDAADLKPLLDSQVDVAVQTHGVAIEPHAGGDPMHEITIDGVTFKADSEDGIKAIKALLSERDGLKPKAARADSLEGQLAAEKSRADAAEAKFKTDQASADRAKMRAELRAEIAEEQRVTDAAARVGVTRTDGESNDALMLRACRKVEGEGFDVPAEFKVDGKDEARGAYLRATFDRLTKVDPSEELRQAGQRRDDAAISETPTLNELHRQLNEDRYRNAGIRAGS